MSDYLKRKVRRVAFFVRGAIRESVPESLCARKSAGFEKAVANGLADDAILSRVNYYNRLTNPFECGTYSRTRQELSRDEGSYYYFDLKEHWRLFPPELKLTYLFGDTVHVPETPTIVKSRPIGDNNQNSVVLKLDKLRHYSLYRQRDTTPFLQKKKRAVWRGGLINSTRQTLINRFGQDNRHDIGYVGKPVLESTQPPSPHLSVKEQLQNRYVISIEGYDVATNLKWIMASQSLCIMPRPRFETWFMEGRLLPGVHYVEVRHDFSDLDEKITHYNDHPDEAEAIIASANQHFQQFTNKANENLISFLVLHKYFELSGQLPQKQQSRGRYQNQEWAS